MPGTQTKGPAISSLTVPCYCDNDDLNADFTHNCNINQILRTKSSSNAVVAMHLSNSQLTPDTISHPCSDAGATPKKNLADTGC